MSCNSIAGLLTTLRQHGHTACTCVGASSSSPVILCKLLSTQSSTDRKATHACQRLLHGSGSLARRSAMRMLDPGRPTVSWTAQSPITVIQAREMPAVMLLSFGLYRHAYCATVLHVSTLQVSSPIKCLVATLPADPAARVLGKVRAYRNMSCQLRSISP